MSTEQPGADMSTGCSSAGLDRPPPVHRYTPTPAHGTDADHVTAWSDGGATACANLCCLCRRRHRLKTHAPGWRFVLTADGDLMVTTPSTVTRITRPPGMHHPAPRAVPPAPPPPAAAPAAEEPPPF
jgi:hypothetical protein